MGLFARISSGGLSVHRFGAALREWADGAVTRQQVITQFNLSGDEVTELDAIAAQYAGLPNNALTRAQFLMKMEDVFILVETGDYNEAVAKTRLGF